MARQPRSLTGKVAVVTGGGRGIGRAIATALVRKGVRVAIGDVDLEAAERTAAELGDAVVGLRLDVTDLPGFTAFLDDVERRLGPIDVLVNNAGIMPVTALEDESGASISRQLEINLRAVIHGTQEAVRRMRPRRHRPHRQHRLAGRQGRLSPPRHLLAPPSTASSGSRRPCASSCGAPAWRSPWSCPGSSTRSSTTGMQEARGIKNLRPEQVADEIVRRARAPALRRLRARAATGALLRIAAAAAAPRPRGASRAC